MTFIISIFALLISFFSLSFASFSEDDGKPNLLERRGLSSLKPLCEACDGSGTSEDSLGRRAGRRTPLSPISPNSKPLERRVSTHRDLHLKNMGPSTRMSSPHKLNPRSIFPVSEGEPKKPATSWHLTKERYAEWYDDQITFQNTSQSELSGSAGRSHMMGPPPLSDGTSTRDNLENYWSDFP